MPRANAALTAKRAEKTAQKTVRTVTITLTLEATENTLQRLNALMMLSDPARKPLEIEDLGPLPFDEPASEPAKNTTPLELDYPAIRRDIRKHMAPYLEKFGAEKARHLFEKYGSKDGQPVPDGDHLLDLLAEIEAALV